MPDNKPITIQYLGLPCAEPVPQLDYSPPHYKRIRFGSMHLGGLLSQFVQRARWVLTPEKATLRIDFEVPDKATGRMINLTYSRSYSPETYADVETQRRLQRAALLDLLIHELDESYQYEDGRHYCEPRGH